LSPKQRNKDLVWQSLLAESHTLKRGSTMANFDGVCEIRRAGTSPEGLAQLDLKAVDGTFDWRWFLSADNLGREMLAVALAAICSNKRVAVQMADVTDWSRVQRLLVIA
jgi:hypothetical protein